MKRILAGATVVLLSAGAHAQGVTDLFRSVTDALGGGRQAFQQQASTPVLGVRGMDQADETAAAPAASEDYVLMEGWTATKPEAEGFAARKGLTSRPAALRKTEAADGGAAPQ